MNTYATVLRREHSGWRSSSKVITSGEGLKGVFSPHTEDLGLARLGDAYIYYQPKLMDMEVGVTAKIRDKFGEMHYMCSPLLIIFCDGAVPREMVAIEEIDSIINSLELL